MAAVWPLHIALVLLAIHRPTLSVCLVPTRPSSPASNEICFDDYNNTDPNIVNHRIDLVTQSYPYEHHQYNTSESNLEPVLESRANSIQSQLPSRKHPQTLVRPPKSSSSFIPVVAYSITKKKPKKKMKIRPGSRMSASTVSVRRKRPNVIYEEAPNDEDSGDQGDEHDLDGEGTEDDYEMRKESAVYGYIHKPEVIEFRGQYYYGQNGEEGSSSMHNKYNKAPSAAAANIEYDSVEAPMQERPHRVSYVPYESYHEEPSATSILLAKLKKVAILKGITAKGLLLASLPLMLTPVLSYLFTPVVIPITATTVAGRRRKRQTASGNTSEWIGVPTNGTATSSLPRNDWVLPNMPEKKLAEAKILLQYLHKVKPDERLATSAVASFLECDGLFLPTDRCLEQLSCEFSDIHNANASKLERAVTSIILAHLLNNEFISTKIKKRLKKAAKYGRTHGGQCKAKYPCERVLLNQAIRQEQARRGGRTRPKENGRNIANGKSEN